MRLKILHVITLFVLLAQMARAEGITPVPTPAVTAETTPPPQLESPTGLARGLLIGFQTAHGIALGAELCAAFDCDGTRPFVAALMLGGGTGLGLSVWATRNGITPGQSLALNTGTLWGFWNGIALTNALQLWDNGDSDVWGTWIGGQLLGLVGSTVLSTTYFPTTGQVSQASSVGIWAGAFTAFAHGIISEHKADPRIIWWSLLIASDLGLAAGSFLPSYFPMSRGRTLVINAGGAVGMLMGMGTDVLIEDKNISQRALFSAATVGSLAGLAAATYLSRHWDVSALDKASLSLLPTPDGPLATINLSW